MAHVINRDARADAAGRRHDEWQGGPCGAGISVTFFHASGRLVTEWLE